MLLRFLVVVFSLAAADAGASPLPDYPFVFTTGTARQDSPPDTVRLGFVVAVRNKDLKAATAAYESTFDSVTKILATAAINDADIDASAVSKSPLSHWDESRNQSVPDGYEVSRRVKITGRDLSKYPEMVKGLLELPNTEEFSVLFDRSDRAKIETELIASAVKDANDRAERMAAQFGRKLGAVHAVSQIPFATLADEFGLGNGGPAYAGAPPQAMFKRAMERFLTPSTITLSATVNVVYELQ